jgi:8-oxo-dGTP pyrophosphatase MutT (NUDIX family)
MMYQEVRDMEVPTFGSPEPGILYRPRRAAYAVIRDGNGAIGVVCTSAGCWLPGGGALDGETPEETIIREVREELGRDMTGIERIGEAVQYFHARSDGTHYRMHAVFFRAALSGGPGGEAEHEVLWIDPNAPDLLFFHACHDWAASLEAGGGA